MPTMKRPFDLAVAVVGLALLVPLLLLVGLAVRLSSPGPALFAAQRVGRAGRPFRLWKFRTMAAAAAGPRVTTTDDARVTSIGRYLRRTRLDELPQLWNVLVGEMSLVGPRPEDPRFVDVDDATWRRVLSVLPGVTGPAQLEFADREQALLGSRDPERDYRDRVLPTKLRVDVDYVERRTFAGDVTILVRTLFRRSRAA
jgi:lipopolysaccharide/colanic/teichoic acid biosynthesis glycosyltransferase